MTLLLTAGADDYPPNGLFRNIRDSSELKTLVQTAETDQSAAVPRILIEAVIQFLKVDQMSNAKEMGLRAIEVDTRTFGREHLVKLCTAVSLAKLFLSHDNLEEARCLLGKD